MLVDIVEKIVVLVFVFLAVSLGYAIWRNLVETAWDYLRNLLGEKVTGWISVITWFTVIAAIVIETIKS